MLDPARDQTEVERRVVSLLHDRSAFQFQHHESVSQVGATGPTGLARLDVANRSRVQRTSVRGADDVQRHARTLGKQVEQFFGRRRSLHVELHGVTAGPGDLQLESHGARQVEKETPLLDHLAAWRYLGNGRRVLGV
jgi:hypothetical protein